MAVQYDDGLDDDGYPLADDGKIPYVRGSEAHVGDFKPFSIGSALSGVIDRAKATISVAPTSDSPIETILGAAILLTFERGGRPLRLSQTSAAGGKGLLLIPQFRWGIYRSDWALFNPKTTGALLIECDGAEFHSSREQIEHDRKKDAAARDRGYLVLRFSGSKIHRGADKCASEIFDLVHGGRK